MHDDLLAKVTNLDNGCKEIESYFSEYDYDVHTPANGFRSYVRIVNTFMSRIAFLLQQEPDGENTGLLQEYETVASTLIKVLDMMKIVREKGLSPDHTHIMDQDIRLFTHAFNITEQDIEPFFSEAGPFWIRTSFVPQFQKVKMFIAMLSPAISEAEAEVHVRQRIRSPNHDPECHYQYTRVVEAHCKHASVSDQHDHDEGKEARWLKKSFS